MSIFVYSRIAAEVEYFTEREQAERDAAADAAYDREQEIERAVTFDDLLEELAQTHLTDAAVIGIPHHKTRQAKEEIHRQEAMPNP